MHDPLGFRRHELWSIGRRIDDVQTRRPSRGVKPVVPEVLHELVWGRALNRKDPVAVNRGPTTGPLGPRQEFGGGIRCGDSAFEPGRIEVVQSPFEEGQ